MGYFLSTASVISIVECLTVHEFCEIFSDSHKPVSLVAKLGYRHTRTEHDTNLTPQTKLWDAEKAQTFVHNFKASDIDQLCSRLDDLRKERNVSQGDVNEVIDSLHEILISNCRSSFGITVSINQKGKPKKKKKKMILGSIMIAKLQGKTFLLADFQDSGANRVKV